MEEIRLITKYIGSSQGLPLKRHTAREVKLLMDQVNHRPTRMSIYHLKKKGQEKNHQIRGKQR